MSRYPSKVLFKYPRLFVTPLELQLHFNLNTPFSFYENYARVICCLKSLYQSNITLSQAPSGLSKHFQLPDVLIASVKASLEAAADIPRPRRTLFEVDFFIGE